MQNHIVMKDGVANLLWEDTITLLLLNVLTWYVNCKVLYTHVIICLSYARTIPICILCGECVCVGGGGGGGIVIIQIFDHPDMLTCCS